MEAVKRLYRWSDTLLSTLLFASTVLHEMSHSLAYECFGNQTEISWSDFAFASERSHVVVESKSTRRQDALAGIVAPYALLVPAFVTSLLVKLVYAPGTTWRLLLAAFLGLQGAGIALQAGPSNNDIEYFLWKWRPRTGRKTKLALSALNSGSIIVVFNLWLFSTLSLLGHW
ncbi:hypothetical protein [Halorussus caseinilyticus]|nr:hypothetical protein [Halorussus sp. DT72]